MERDLSQHETYDKIGLVAPSACGR